jgi:hypothetical protein
MIGPLNDNSSMRKSVAVYPEFDNSAHKQARLEGLEKGLVRQHSEKEVKDCSADTSQQVWV